MILRERLTDGDVALATLDSSAADGPYLGWMQDAEVERFLESRFADHSRQSLIHFIESSNDDPDVLLAGILLADRHVGNIKIGIDTNHARGEMGIMIGDKSAWGRGVARKAIGILAAHAFGELGVVKLTAGCYAGNVGSIRAFEAAGFHREAVRPGHYLFEGKRVDGVYLARFGADIGSRV